MMSLRSNTQYKNELLWERLCFITLFHVMTYWSDLSYGNYFHGRHGRVTKGTIVHRIDGPFIRTVLRTIICKTQHILYLPWFVKWRQWISIYFYHKNLLQRFIAKFFPYKRFNCIMGLLFSQCTRMISSVFHYFTVFFAPFPKLLTQRRILISILRKKVSTSAKSKSLGLSNYFLCTSTLRETCSCVYEVELIHVQEDFHVHLYLLPYIKILLSKSIQVLLYNNTADLNTT